MPIVRESPRAKVSGEKSEAQWPPRSPFQALLSSPSGRKKWRDYNDGNARGNGRDVSPSPVKNGRRAERDVMVDSRGEGSGGEEDEDEDEEMLELKLEALKAKLKLKKLQKAKKDGGSVSSRAGSERGGDGGVQVPLSPVKERKAPEQPPTSPARARLGIQTAAKAQDVSLKRARDGTHLPRADSRQSAGRPGQNMFEDASRPTTSFSERLAKSKEDAQARKAKEDRIERGRSKGFYVDAPPIAQFRQPGGTERGGNINGSTKGTPADMKRRPNGVDTPNPSVGRSNSTRALQTAAHSGLTTNGMSTFHAPHSSSKDNITSTANDKTSDTDSSLPVQDHPASPSRNNQEEPPPHSYDPISQTHLTKRHITHPTLTRQLADKETYTLPRLLREVKSPHYDPPDCETDFVLLAILASKSQPFDQKPKHRTSDQNKPQEDAFGPAEGAGAPRKKFMVLHLTDLKWDLDCFLFGSAFDAFWKLTPGTLLAILNPGIMPPKQGQTDTGRFCLKLASAEESVLEIGTARDLGWCRSLRRDGRECGVWVDRRKSGHCSFHLEMGVEREGRKGRMEVNGMWRSHEGTTGRGGGSGRGRGHQQGRGGSQQSGRGTTFHHEYGRLYDVPPSAAGFGATSAANLLDAEDRPFNTEAEEASRKRIVAAQRERDLARKLGQMGQGVGAEYLRTSTNTAASPASPTKKGKGGEAFFEKPSATSLGLLANRAEHARLSPPKDRKRHFGLGAVSSAGPEAMGWGDARKAGLLLQASQGKEPGRGERSPERGRKLAGAMEEGGSVSTRGTGSRSPQKKKARFMLEEGIKEPGRESLGTTTGAETDEGVGNRVFGKDDDDDDGLDIV